MAYATAGGTATEGTDYTAASGTLTFAAGETTKTVSVTLADDSLDEPEEAFELRLSAAVNATLSRGTADGHDQRQRRCAEPVGGGQVRFGGGGSAGVHGDAVPGERAGGDGGVRDGWGHGDGGDGLHGGQRDADVRGGGDDQDGVGDAGRRLAGRAGGGVRAAAERCGERDAVTRDGDGHDQRQRQCAEPVGGRPVRFGGCGSAGVHGDAVPGERAGGDGGVRDGWGHGDGGDGLHGGQRDADVRGGGDDQDRLGGFD